MLFQSRRRLHGVAGVVVVGCTFAIVTACGSAPRGLPSGMMTMPDGTVMRSSQMAPMSGMTDSGPGPSASARMICSDEVAGAVQRNVAVSATPPHHASWADTTYTCTYVLSGGTLELSVKDLTSATTGRMWFEDLRERLTRPATIRGMANLGFPAFETPSGDVVFLKDGKTLWVDATDVPQSLVPPGSSRTGVAYGVAAAVIACWKE